MEGSISRNIHLVDVNILFNAKIKRFLSLKNCRKMESVLSLTVIDMDVAAKLLQYTLNLLLIFQNGILDWSALQRVIIIEEHGFLMWILFKEEFSGLGVILT